MADNKIQYGFRPVRSLLGGPYPEPEVMTVATGYQASPGGTSVDLNIGDPVKRLTDGTAALLAAGDALFYGVIVGVLPYWDGSKMVPTNKLPGGTSWGTVRERASKILVLRADKCLWEGDADDSSTATTYAGYEAFLGENTDIAYSADSTAKKAYPRVDISLHGTATATIRLVEISSTAMNEDFSGNYVKLLFENNESATQLASHGTTGV